MFRLLFLILCGSATQAISFNVNCPPSVKTKYGQIEGKWGLSFGGRRYAMFEGIPYAKPPVGELRFETPQPIDAWNGTWKATTINRCIQISKLDDGIIGEEDCLYLNIYVPEVDDLKILDVVIYIHGGSFKIGHSRSDTDEKYIMDRDIVFATVHYRLDAFGFLSTANDVVPGNNGLKDQSLAIRWIRDNIENFGGNPKSITLTGCSAGGSSVHYHYLSPWSRNLFERGMSLSGTALNHFALQKNPKEHAEKLAKLLGCDTSNTELMVACMKTRPAHFIVTTANEINPSPRYPYFAFVPVIENSSMNPFLSEHPYALLKDGRVYDVPWIVSVTSHEGALYSIPLMKFRNNIEKTWETDSKYINNYDNTLPDCQEISIASKIRKFYFQEGPIQYEGLTKMITDRLIRVHSIMAAKMQSQVTRSPVYFYVFDYDSPQGIKTLLGEKKYRGSCHGDDLPYFFGGIIVKPLSQEEIKLQNMALNLLYTFAHNGIPLISNITWLAIDDEFNYLNIRGPDNIGRDLKKEFTSENFWSSLGLLENENIFLDKTINEV